MKKVLTLLALVSIFSISAFASTESSSSSEITERSSIITDAENAPEFDVVQPLHEPSHFQRVVCYSEDHHGYRYSAVGYDAHQTQHEAHHRCELRSHGDCWDLGCRYY